MRYLTTAQTAALLRAALKAAFPKVKFSVRSNNYSMGSSIYVRWTDGPLESAVDAIGKQFAGSTFNGMTDCRESTGNVLTDFDGSQVRPGCDYVNTHRKSSDTEARRVCAAIVAQYGLDVTIEPTDTYETLKDKLDGLLYSRRNTTFWRTYNEVLADLNTPNEPVAEPEPVSTVRFGIKKIRP